MYTVFIFTEEKMQEPPEPLGRYCNFLFFSSSSEAVAQILCNKPDLLIAQCSENFAEYLKLLAKLELLDISIPQLVYSGRPSNSMQRILNSRSIPLLNVSHFFEEKMAEATLEYFGLPIPPGHKKEGGPLSPPSLVQSA